MPQSLSPDKLERAFAVAREGIASGGAHAVVLAVADRERTVRCEALWPACDRGHSQESIFLLASITKTFIGAALTQLAESGKLRLSDTVARYLPEFGRYGKDKVTIWHLLTHTSGLAEEVWEPLWKAKAPPEEHVRAACEAFLHFEPGAAWQYCNLSFWALAEIISRVSETHYTEYIQQAICDPLGMEDTGFSFEGPQAERRLPVRFPKQAGLLQDEEGLNYSLSLALPAGGLCSTAADLVRYGQAILNGLAGRPCPILSPAGVATMTRLHTAGINTWRDGTPSAYGLGWVASPPHGGVLDGEGSFGHGGATGTLLWVHPKYDLVYVFLTNVWASDDSIAYKGLDAAIAAASRCG